MSDSVRINGLLISWASCIWKIGGERYSGASSLEFADGVERSLQYGMGKDHAPRGRPRGKYVPEPFVATVPVATAEAIRQQLAREAGPTTGISNVEVPITLQYIEPNDATVLVEMLRVTLEKNEASHEESGDGLMEKLTFQPQDYKRNGISLHDTSAVGA